MTNFKSHRRIDELKAIAENCNLTKEEARNFGDLRSTATWEKLLLAHGLEFDRKIAQPLDTAHSTDSQINPVNFFEWVDFGQALALALASVGFALLILGQFPRINPLNLLPVKITIQVGK